jgi:hypothetical protein
MGVRIARRRRGEAFVVATLALLVLALAALVALSVRSRATDEPRMTDVVEISDQGRSPVDPFADDSSPSTDGEATPSRTQ